MIDRFSTDVAPMYFRDQSKEGFDLTAIVVPMSRALALRAA
jgi:hypothetical protein